MSAPTAMVRLPEEARDSLKAVAEAMGVTMQEMLVQLIAEAENHLFFKKMQLAYSELNDDPETLKSEQQSLGQLDMAAGDGLEGILNVESAQTG